jgi:hypothetical protein
VAAQCTKSHGNRVPSIVAQNRQHCNARVVKTHSLLRQQMILGADASYRPDAVTHYAEALSYDKTHLPSETCHGTADVLFCSIRNQPSQYR